MKKLVTVLLALAVSLSAVLALRRAVDRKITILIIFTERNGRKSLSDRG